MLVITVKPGLDEIAGMSQELRRMLQGLATPAKLVHGIVLIAEELLANSVHHGQVAKESVVQIAIETEKNGIIFTYCDCGIPFDIVRAAQDAIAEPDTGKVGGLGLVMIRELSDSATYRHHDGKNETRLRFVYS